MITQCPVLLKYLNKFRHFSQDQTRNLNKNVLWGLGINFIALKIHLHQLLLTVWKKA